MDTPRRIEELKAQERETEELLAEVVERAEERGLNVGALTSPLMGGCRMLL